MNFAYKKEANIKVGQKLFGIIAVSSRTYEGVHPVEVYSINWNDEEVVFEVEQPCRYVSCTFDEMEHYVFETEEEAKEAEKSLEFGDGMPVYEHDIWY